MKRARHIAIILSIFIISLVDIGISFAQSEYVVFGPKQYDKPKGSPVTYTDTFQVYMGINYTLWVQSGQDGLNEVKNVSVSINGTEVLDSSDLRKSNPSTKAISLQSNNIIKVVLKGQGGNFIKAKVLAPSLNITITSPSAGEIIPKPEIMVKGNIINFTGNETGVTVNGKVAHIYGNQFIANNVSVVEGINTITVTAKDTANNSATAFVTVNAVTTGSYVKLSSNIESGIAPLTANFSASASNFSPASYQIDYEGDGVVAYTGTTFENINHVYTSEGIFYPALTVTDNQGNTYTDTISIMVMNKTTIDSLLKSKWEGMKGTLINKDIEKGLNYFLESSKEIYRQAFNIIIDELPQIISGMQNIEMVYLEDNVAKYRVNRVHDIDGVSQVVTYYIYLVKDANGIWRIDRF